MGYEIGSVLKQQGAEVVISGRDPDKVEKAVQKLGFNGIKADVIKEDDVVALFEFAREKVGGVNVLINNAGIGTFNTLTDTHVEEFQKMWEVNVKGYFLAGKQAAKIFQQQQYSNIINIGSTASLKGYAKGSAYVSSNLLWQVLPNAGVPNFVRTMRVMQINPIEVITDFISKAEWLSKTRKAN
ncbi:MAG: SDR family NAD(P)-dependent oxidoreductase [Pedobacter terrae]